jgi:pimeloyl-ACP methyl ester carboxylesterase
MKQICAGVLTVAYHDSGKPDGSPVVLLHGFPYDVHAYDEVVPRLVDAGCRVITPYLRGYGPTRFLTPDTPRSGQPAAPENEHRHWYQYYFHGERGRAGLAQNRHALCKLLWQLWSPNWRFDDATYDRTAASFDNPDFVDVVIHSYRHRFGLVPGDPAVEETEHRLTALPRISVPTIALDGGGDGVMPAGGSERHSRFFTSKYERRIIPSVGHNLPQEAPEEFAEAILSLLG